MLNHTVMEIHGVDLFNVDGMSENLETMNNENVGSHFVDLGFSIEAAAQFLQLYRPEVRVK